MVRIKTEAHLLGQKIEHTDWKDIRLYVQTFRKQNINFLEILFTPYKILNPMYKEQWDRLVESREEIARYSPIQAIKAMKGTAMEKYFAMEHHYPSRMEWINKFGYDPKQLHHLLRVEKFIENYVNGIPYGDCLVSENPEFLIKVKKGEAYTLEDAQCVAKTAIEHINEMCTNFLQEDWEIDKDIDILLDNVQYEIMKIAIKKEICK